MKPWLWPALVGILGRALSLLPLDPLCQRDECNYLALAASVSQGQMLGMAGEATERFWLWAPGYPYLLGATEWLTGDAEWFKLVQVLSFPVLAWLGFRVSGGGSAGRMTAWLLALHPTLAYFAGHIWSETVYITLLFALLAALVARGGGGERAPGRALRRALRADAGGGNLHAARATARPPLGALAHAVGLGELRRGGARSRVDGGSVVHQGLHLLRRLRAQ